MSRPALVILDCDGVLVDSERITTSLLAEVATENGWAMTGDEAVRRFKGRDLHQVQAEIEQRVGRLLGDEFLPAYRERMAEVFQRQGVPAVEGAPELLDWLDNSGVTHAVASNGPLTKMRLTLGTIGVGEHGPGGWFGRFEGRLFSAYEVGAWKPDPGLFLHAAERMGAHPDACVVVEDSVSGVRAASAAGMRAIGLADLTEPELLRDAGAAEVRSTLGEVRELLGGWLH